MLNFISEYKEIIIAIITASVALITILYPMWRKERMSIWEVRYYKVIFPIFDLIEPYLYKEPPKKILSKVLDVLSDNRAIAGSGLLYYASVSAEDYKNYKKVCDIIVNEYDNLCFLLHLKGRTPLYKLRRKQYPNRTLWFINLIVFILRQLYLYFVLIILFLTLAIGILLLITYLFNH